MINKISITLKMPKKGVTKTRVSVTLDIDLVKALNKECQERTMKMSSYMEKLIKIGLKNEKK